MRANVTLAFNCQKSVTAMGRNLQINRRCRPGGDDRDRTDDLRLAKPALSQLSYIPERRCALDGRCLTRAGGPE